LPEPAFEEQQINRDDHGHHQHHEECGGHLTSHVNAPSNVRRSMGCLTFAFFLEIAQE
jgi:hypothetical protein